MKLNNSKNVVGLGAVALISMAMSGPASAVDFTASATVQNALTITNTADMNLGTVFATKAMAGKYSYMTLAADGTMGSSAGSASVTLLGLGGQSAATGTVAVGTTTPFTLTLPAAELTTAGNVEGTGEVAAAITALKALTDQVEVRITDPATARFQLVNFTVGAVTSGTAATDCAAAITGTATPVCTLTPDFGATSVGFGIGATIVTDVNSSGAGDRDAYQAAAYSGTFTVTASY